MEKHHDGREGRDDGCRVVDKLMGSEHADVVLPASAWPEKTGTVTNTGAADDYLGMTVEVKVTRERAGTTGDGLVAFEVNRGFFVTNVGLEGVLDRRVADAIGRRVDELCGQRRHAAQPLEKIQRRSLGGEQRNGIAGDERDRGGGPLDVQKDGANVLQCDAVRTGM
mgnify:CR=1 FL=1